MIQLTLVIFLILASLNPPARAAFGDPKSSESENLNPLQARAALRPEVVEPGGTTELAIDLDLAEGYHAYVERFRLQIESPDDLKLDTFKIKPTVEFQDKVSNSTKLGVSGHAKLRTVIEVPPGFKTGSHQVKLKLVYQACNDDHCLFPKTIELAVKLKVE